MTFDTRQALSIQAARTINVGRGSGGGGPVGDWLVHAGIARYSNFSLEAIYPRPDAETASFAYHRKTHSQLNYRVPVGVRGGSVPYRFELIQAPEDMTIGQEMNRTVDIETGKIIHAPGETYGIINWEDAEATGTHTVQVRVTDQLGETIDLTWEVECDDDAFVFLNSTSGNDANAGTFEAPLQTFHAGLWRGSDADNTYAGKIAIFTGTFDIYAAEPNTSPALSAAKPLSYIGVGGCTFNTSQGHFRTSGNITDLTEMGIDFTGSRTDLSNNRIHNFTNRLLRHTQSECSFDNITPGTNPTDNPACNFYADGLSHQYLYYSRNVLGDNCAEQLYCIFESQHVLDEFSEGMNLNIATGTNGGSAVHWKDDTSFAELRFAMLKGTANQLIHLAQQNTNWPGAVSATDQEVRFNTLIYNSSGSSVLQALFQNSQSSSGSNGRNLFIYRNTIISSRRAYTIRNSSIEGQTFPVNVFDDLYVDGDGSTTSGLDSVDTPEGGQNAASLSISDFNATGELVGSARATYLGLAGAEIAGEAA